VSAADTGPALRREWLALAVALALLVAAASAREWLARADLALYDLALTAWRRPAPTDIVIVEIDDRSVTEIGRWPWRRAIHATLIERIAADGARAIGLDLILAEADSADPASDAALAQAMHGAKVVLPMVLAPPERPDIEELLPLPQFAAAAAGIGFAQVKLDSDGRVRRLQTWAQAPDLPRLPSFALALTEAATGTTLQPPMQLPLPYAGPPGHFQRVSYVRALRGDLPAGYFRDRIVLIGANASGLSSSYATPASAAGVPMASVEIHANAVDALRQPITLRTLPAPVAATISAAAVLLLLVALRRASPRAGMALTAAAAAALIAAGPLLLRLAEAWFPPAAALAGSLLAYPWWSWRRLESAQRFFDAELEQLRREPPLLARPAPAAPPSIDPLQRRIELIQSENQARRQARRFLSDAVESLPVGMIVADATGCTLLYNRRAIELLGRTGLPAAGEPLAQILGPEPPLPAPGAAASQAEVRIGDRVLLIGIAASLGEQGQPAGYIASLVDLTELRRALAGREEMLRFLSHDLRSPLAAIISITDILQDPEPPGDPAMFSPQHIQDLARRALDLADDFMRLARAEALNPRQFRPVDMVVVASQAALEVTGLGRRHNIGVELETQESPGTVLVRGDDDLLRRALINLLNNAIRHGPDGVPVRLRLAAERDHVAIAVGDRGPGMSEQEVSQLFRSYVRLRGARRGEGVGLGLVIVKAVAEKHRGSIAVDSRPGEGSTFTLKLPRIAPAGGAGGP
jgi:hypothetical protein